MPEQAKSKGVKRSRPARKAPRTPAAPRRIPQPEDIIFALDTGTRTVIGVVGKRLPDGGLKVLDYEQLEHPGRAMMDGQVEDIAQVGRLVAEVKEKLEDRLHMTLSRVCLAAAGRMLRTVQVKVSRALPGPRTTADRDMVLGLEGEAIEQAQEQVKDAGQDSASYYCVGYSIVEYCMDGQPVSRLIGHTCSEISVELIAAFLPYSVVEGLYAAVDMTDLEVVSLTLEPIAAINVLIPRELRLLNLALVDIGAGTSDIAVCREGKIVSYEMATVAGDELTETLIHKYLTDFTEAERLKRSLTEGIESVEYQNILGLPCTVEAAEIQTVLSPVVETLAQTIAEKILLCNGAAPAAVFLIGGGSQVPGLGEALAASLDIPEANVAVGSRRALKGVDTTAYPLLTGPEFVTPLGIAVTSIIQECFHFFGVSINGKRLKLLNTGKMRMMDVLLMAGYRTGQIIGRSGRSLIFTLNGAPHTVRGGYPEHAVIRLNGESVGVDADVRPGDTILITPAQNGASAQAIVRDFIPPQGAAAMVLNGAPARPDDPVRAGDILFITPAGPPPKPGETPPPPPIPAYEPEPEPEAPAAPQADPTQPLLEEPLTEVAVPVSGSLTLNLNGESISLPLSEKQPAYYIMNLLERAGVDPADPKGVLHMECNGEDVGFMHQLTPGARVVIGWK